jgi:hypothetical protein
MDLVDVAWEKDGNKLIQIDPNCSNKIQGWRIII